MQTLWANAVRGERRLDALRDPLGLFARLKAGMEYEELLREARSDCRCSCTHDWFEEKVSAVGQEIWNLLPEIFDFQIEAESAY